MNSNILRRVPLFVLGLLALFALSSTSALAAGQPTLSNVVFSKPSLTGEPVSAVINPNGAATEYKIEYGGTESLGSSTTPVSVGSGTSEVPINTELTGLKEGHEYYARLVAYNSYGSTKSSIAISETGHWLYWNPPGETVTYSSSGTFSIKFNGKIGGSTTEINCSSNGEGYLPTSKKSGEYWIFPSNCGVYFDGKKGCSAKITAFNLNSNLDPFSKGFTMTISGGPCFFSEGPNTMYISKPFTIGTLADEFAVSHSYTLTSATSYGAYTATVTDTSTWSLDGANSGNKFRFLGGKRL